MMNLSARWASVSPDVQRAVTWGAGVAPLFGVAAIAASANRSSATTALDRQQGQGVSLCTLEAVLLRVTLQLDLVGLLAIEARGPRLCDLDEGELSIESDSGADALPARPGVQGLALVRGRQR
jgi:hypothetical protein